MTAAKDPRDAVVSAARELLASMLDGFALFSRGEDETSEPLIERVRRTRRLRSALRALDAAGAEPGAWSAPQPSAADAERLHAAGVRPVNGERFLGGWAAPAYEWLAVLTERDRLRADLARVEAERDKANAKAEQYMRDWYDSKSEFGDAMAKMREKLREAESALSAERISMTSERDHLAEAVKEWCDAHTLVTRDLVAADRRARRWRYVATTLRRRLSNLADVNVAVVSSLAAERARVERVRAVLNEWDPERWSPAEAVQRALDGEP